MRKLETEFKKDGFNYRQIWREGLFAIFEQTKNEVRYAYEAIRIQERPAGEIMGNWVEERESMPPSASWGVWGFTCKTLESAHKRIKEMQEHNLELEAK